MPMFININKGGMLTKYARYAPAEGISTRTTASKLGVELFGTPEVILMGGDNDGKSPEGPIRANQTVLIRLGNVHPQKFHMLLVVNPDILRNGQVGSPSLIEPEPTSLDFTFKASRQIDLSELPYLARLYLLD